MHISSHSPICRFGCAEVRSPTLNVTKCNLYAGDLSHRTSASAMYTIAAREPQRKRPAMLFAPSCRHCPVSSAPKTPESLVILFLLPDALRKMIQLIHSNDRKAVWVSCFFVQSLTSRSNGAQHSHLVANCSPLCALWLSSTCRCSSVIVGRALMVYIKMSSVERLLFVKFFLQSPAKDRSLDQWFPLPLHHRYAKCS